MSTTTTTTISFPDGMILTEKKLVDTHLEFEQWGRPRGVEETLWPTSMVKRGFVYIIAAKIADLKAGDPIQIDRYHCTVASVRRPKLVVTDIDDEPVMVCRVNLRDERTFI